MSLYTTLVSFENHYIRYMDNQAYLNDFLRFLFIKDSNPIITDALRKEKGSASVPVEKALENLIEQRDMKRPFLKRFKPADDKYSEALMFLDSAIGDNHFLGRYGHDYSRYSHKALWKAYFKGIDDIDLTGRCCYIDTWIDLLKL